MVRNAQKEFSIPAKELGKLIAVCAQKPFQFQSYIIVDYKK